MISSRKTGQQMALHLRIDPTNYKHISPTSYTYFM